MTIRIIFLSIILGLSTQISAQSKKEKKLLQAIEALETTEFIKSYKECKLRVEKVATDFKLQEEFLEADDITRVQLSYQESKEEFDLILDNLKRKLLNKKYRKFMIDNPEEYTELVQLKLEKAMNNYEANCVKLIEEISGTEVVGFGISDIVLLVNIVGDIFGAIKNISKQLDKMNEIYIEEKFISKLRVKDWDEL